MLSKVERQREFLIILIMRATRFVTDVSFSPRQNIGKYQVTIRTSKGTRLINRSCREIFGI